MGSDMHPCRYAYLRSLLLPSGYNIVQYGNDVALVAGYSAPQLLDFMGKGGRMLGCHIVQALKQALAPVACNQGTHLHLRHHLVQ